MKSFKQYLRLSFLKATIGIAALAFFLFMLFLALNLRFTTIQANKQDNINIMQSIETWQSSIEQTALELSKSDDVLQALSLNKKSSELNSHIYSKINRLPVKCMFVLSNFDNIILSNLNKNNISLYEQSLFIRDIYNKVSKTENTDFWRLSRIPYLHNQNTAFMYVKSIMNKENHQGLIYIDVTNDSIRETLGFSKSDAIAIVDRFNNVVYTDNIKLIGSLGKLAIKIESNGFYSLDNKGYYTSIGELNNSNFKVLSFSSTVLHDQIKKYGFITIGFATLLLFIASVIISDKVSQKNLKPINLIVNTIKNQDLSKRIDKLTYTEFQPLYTEFNALMDRIHNLIKNNDELAEKKRIMEVKQLKEQFNPHFVFNVMENIRFVMLQDSQKAADMLVAFASILRYGIDETKTYVELGTDLEYLSDYLLLQSIRYGDSLKYSFDVPESILECKIPKLLVQPMVENSLKYGYNQYKVLKILIKANVKDSFLNISIVDNGMGINDEELARLQNMLQDESKITSHIGLYNTHRAIRLMYGKDCGVKIYSKHGYYTKLEIKLPEVY